MVVWGWRMHGGSLACYHTTCSLQRCNADPSNWVSILYLMRLRSSSLRHKVVNCEVTWTITCTNTYMYRCSSCTARCLRVGRTLLLLLLLLGSFSISHSLQYRCVISTRNIPSTVCRGVTKACTVVVSSSLSLFSPSEQIGQTEEFRSYYKDHALPSPATSRHSLLLPPCQLPSLEALLQCVQMGWMGILVSNDQLSAGYLFSVSASAFRLGESVPERALLSNSWHS